MAHDGQRGEAAGDPQETPGAGPADAAQQPAALFWLFSLLFAVSLLLHQLWWYGFELLSPHFVVVLAALWVVVRPASVGRFLTMTSAEVVSVAIDMPDIGSHTLLVLVIGACVLAFAGWSTLRARRLPEAGWLFERIAPFLRVQMLVVYAAAAIAKMNTAFLDGEVSCAVALSGQVAWFDPALLAGSWRELPAIWGTLAIEVSLPLCSQCAGRGCSAWRWASSSTRSSRSPATSVLRAGACPLRRLSPARRAEPGAGRGRRSARAGSPGSAPPAPRELARRLSGRGRSLAPVCGDPLVPTRPRARADRDGTRLVVVAMVVAPVVVLAPGGRPGEAATHPRRSLRVRHPVFALGTALLVANSLSPYLGLKTESSFTMFSNLGTEAGYWNHLLIPEGVRVFGYQDELVQVIGANDPGLGARALAGNRIVRYELERYLREHPGATRPIENRCRAVRRRWWRAPSFPPLRPRPLSTRS